MFLWTASNLFATIMTRHQKDNVFKLLILLDKLLGWNKIWLSIIWLFGRLAGRKFGNWSQIISCMPFLWKYIYRWWTRTSIFPSGRPVSRYLFCTDLRRVRIMYFNVREAPLKLASPLFGHCPNSDYTPPRALKRALWGTFFPGRFEQICQITVLTVHKCTKHPGKP